MTQDEILDRLEDRLEVCPWKERMRGGPYVCARYLYTNVSCGGSCSWIFDYFDYPKIKELETKKNKL